MTAEPRPTILSRLQPDCEGSALKTPPHKKSPPGRSLTFADVRVIALSMPEVEETTAYGMPAFKAGKTRFAGSPVERSDVEPNTLGVRVSFEVRDALIASRPDLYYLTEHFAPYPAVLARLSKMRRAELRELLGTAWRYAMEGAGPVKRKRPAARRGGARLR